MKVWQRFLWITVAVLGLAVLSISCYGLGEDLLGWLPLWSVKGILGLVFLAIGIVIAVVFILGIVKIKEICSG